MPPFLGGGDMIDIVKIEKSTYADPPLRFEAGTPPIVEAIALGEAIDWVNEIGIEEIGRHEKNIIDYGTSLLDSIDGVSVFGKAPNKTGVISFTMDCAHPHDIATIIDREGIAVRAGHHCAQPLMDAFKLVSTTRASVGAYSTKEDFDELANSLTKVRKIFGYCKAGYVGTLDPLASGFLPIALGDATKTIRYLENISKEYIFEVEWGVKTNTGDIEGIVEKTCKIYPSKANIKNATKKFKGKYFQEPQKFSSKPTNFGFKWRTFDRV